MALRKRAFARLAVALAAMLSSVAVVSPLCAGGTAHAAQLTAAQALRQAAKHDRLARRFDKLKKREQTRARKTKKQAVRTRRKQLRKIQARQSALTRTMRQLRKLKRRARGHTRKAKQYAAKARWHRREAARLRRLAALLSQPKPTPPLPPRRGPIPLGAAVNWSELQSDSRLHDAFLRYFDQMTAENEMKWAEIHPGVLSWNFATADAMVDWARAHGKRVRGHTLIWNKQNPDWLEDGSWDRDTLLLVMENHIKTVMEHFKGRVEEWDVVNEAVDFNGGPDQNIWYQVIGPDYIDYAFKYAHEADPNAKLYYNDQGLDVPDHPHSQGVVDLVRNLRSRGVPVDGVGMQGHVSTQGHGSQQQVTDLMHQFTALGLDVAITEMDVRLEGSGTTAEKLAAQRSVYGEYARACRYEPRCTSFTTWGIADPYSWYVDEGGNPALAPLLFDGSFNPKPAFAEVQDWIRTP